MKAFAFNAIVESSLTVTSATISTVFDFRVNCVAHRKINAGLRSSCKGLPRIIYSYKGVLKGFRVLVQEGPGAGPDAIKFSSNSAIFLQFLHRISSISPINKYVDVGDSISQSINQSIKAFIAHSGA